jgi:HPt (histidine-containing phosphotransfer) domain-containing protein
MSGDDGRGELFQQLREEYLAESAERLVALQADIAGLRHGRADAVHGLRSRLHQLAGSGGSYGFPGVSTIAREAELWLATAPSLAAIVPRMEETVAQLTAEFERGKKTVRGER